MPRTRRTPSSPFPPVAAALPAALVALALACGALAAPAVSADGPGASPAPDAASSADAAAVLDAPAAADAPDYDDPSNWAYWDDEADPDRLDAPAGSVAGADSSDGSDPAEKPADLFIVCPTVAAGGDGALTMDLADEGDRANFVGALNMELGIYDGQCAVYAPYYRQATFAAYVLGGEEIERATGLAYGDVRAAFERYLEANPEGPLVLAGFSQGADMVLRLVKEYFGDEGLQGRLVAVYAIGWRLTQEECDAYPWLRAAQGEDDTGVVVTFNSEAPGVDDSLMVPAGTATLAINPLNWRTDGTYAPAALNLGACFTDYGGNIVREVPGLCGAYLDPERGTLKVVGVTPEEYPAGLDGFEDGVYHIYDYQFFYRNLQENVAVRLAAYLDGR